MNGDMEPKKRNLLLPAKVDQLVDGERDTGVTITRTISAAVYWYFKKLKPSERESARKECEEWLKGEPETVEDVALETHERRLERERAAGKSVAKRAVARTRASQRTPPGTGSNKQKGAG